MIIFLPRDYVVYGLVMLGLIVAPTAIFNREGLDWWNIADDISLFTLALLLHIMPMLPLTLFIALHSSAIFALNQTNVQTCPQPRRIPATTCGMSRLSALTKIWGNSQFTSPTFFSSLPCCWWVLRDSSTKYSSQRNKLKDSTLCWPRRMTMRWRWGRLFFLNVNCREKYWQVEEEGQDQMSDEIHTVEVWQSFKHNSTFFPSYLLRTIFELIFSLMLTLYFLLMGMRELVNWNDLSLSDITLDDFLNLKKDNVRIFCDVHGDFYECAGVPTQVNFILMK